MTSSPLVPKLILPCLSSVTNLLCFSSKRIEKLDETEASYNNLYWFYFEAKKRFVTRRVTKGEESQRFHNVKFCFGSVLFFDNKHLTQPSKHFRRSAFNFVFLMFKEKLHNVSIPFWRIKPHLLSICYLLHWIRLDRPSTKVGP